jgi:hypothetical protein
MKYTPALFVLALALLTTSAPAAAQIKGASLYAKEYSKDIALFRAKAYVMTEVLGADAGVVQFEIDPLAASSSGDLTSLAYQCPSKNKEGMVLGFFGDRWNPAGVVYQQYAFKNLPKDKALELLALIDKQMADNATYFLVNGASSNIYFHYDDMTFLINKGDGGSTSIRVFWNDFDADWQPVAWQRTKKRLLKKLN